MAFTLVEIQTMIPVQCYLLLVGSGQQLSCSVLIAKTIRCLYTNKSSHNSRGTIHRFHPCRKLELLQLSPFVTHLSSVGATTLVVWTQSLAWPFKKMPNSTKMVSSKLLILLTLSLTSSPSVQRNKDPMNMRTQTKRTIIHGLNLARIQAHRKNWRV
jgi:hypothetical protein